LEYIVEVYQELLDVQQVWNRFSNSCMSGFGGYNVTGTGKVNTTEEYNGSAWGSNGPGDLWL
jgi:hypothetical protein